MMTWPIKTELAILTLSPIWQDLPMIDFLTLTSPHLVAVPAMLAVSIFNNEEKKEKKKRGERSLMKIVMENGYCMRVNSLHLFSEVNRDVCFFSSFFSSFP